MDKLKIFTRYDAAGASSRLRYYSYAPLFDEAGIETEFEPLFDRHYLKSFYNRFKKPLGRTVLSLFRRAKSMLNMPGHAIIEYELLPFFPAWLELAALKKTRYVLNFDDNVWQKYNRFFWLRNKYDRLIKNAAGVIVANEFLLHKVKELNANVILIPTVVDLERYSANKYHKFDRFTLIWIGNPATYPYLEQSKHILYAISKKIDYELLVVGSKSLGKRPIPGVKMRFAEWSEEKEAEHIAQAHVGIMPLPANDDFARGKSAYKLIQYMASGIPSIASAVGENVNVIHASQAGVLASSPQEWAAAAEKLAFDDNFYHSLAANAVHAAPEYSLQKYAPVMLDFVRQTLF